MDSEQTQVEDERTETDGAVAAAHTPPDRYGRYLVTGRLGAGGMGVVYEGVDELLGRDVAIKVILGREAKGSDDPRARLLREARALAALSHPNVVEVYEVGTRGVDVFVVMERVRGQTMSAWLGRRRGWREVLSVLVEAGRGLQAAHDVGLVHRDFKPANVMIGDDGRTRVLDFGLVWADDPSRLSSSPDPAADDPGDLAPDERLTRAGVVMGTPAYMSPEQLAGRPIGPAADQWAFCIALFEALYGRRPFDARTIDELAEQTAKAPPRQPRIGSVPRWLWRAIERGLARAPENRWPTLCDLLDELDHRRRRGGSLAWGVVPIAIVGAAIALSIGERESDACENGAVRIARTWNDPTRARVRAAFIGAEAAKDGERFVAQLDARAEAWASAFAAVCAARGGAEAWPLATLDRAAACLDVGERRIATVVAAFTANDPRTVWRAGDLLDDLPPPERCADAESLAGHVDPPPDSAVARTVEDTRERIAWIDALVKLDRVDEALELARMVLRDAEATGYTPVVAEALLAVGDVLSRTNDAEEGLARTEDAYWTAYGARHHDVAAAAGSLLVQETGRKGAFEDALEWAERTRAILERSAAAIELMPALDRREANVLMRLGRYDEAESLVVSSLAVLEMEEVQRPGETAWTLNQRGNIARNRGEPRQGITWLALAAETLEEAYGESHSQVGAVLVNLGLARLEANEVDAARDVLQRAVRINESVLGPEHRELAPGLMALAHAELKLGRTQEAIALFERARAINTAQFGASSLNVAYAVEGLARVAAEEGRHEDAIAYYEEVISIRVPGAIAPSWRAQALLGLAVALVAAGRERERARALAQEATKLFVEARGKDSNDVRRARKWIEELD